jgi:DNA-binding SARP family transcriptional activator/tetratricopeptide (TPR) repeat protein
MVPPQRQSLLSWSCGEHHNPTASGGDGRHDRGPDAILAHVTVRVTVCGALTVVRDGEQLTGPRLGSRKARVLTAALASGRGSPVAVDRLVEAVWGDDPPRDPQGNLATLASRLRRVVGDGFITQSGTTYALTREVDLDLDAASALLDAAAARLGRSEPTLAVAATQRALGLLGDDGSLATELDGDWADPLRREAATLCREARHLLAAAATATGQADVAEQAAADAIRADAYDERAHRDLMTALTVAGRATAALDVYAGLAGRLAEELGTDPDPETQSLHLQVLRGDRPGGSATTSPDPPRSLLVGRDEELAALDRAWASASAGGTELVVVAGVPGIGKTRLLQAAADLAARSGGLVLALRCRPGERSLFLQPYLEVLRPVLLSLPASALHSLLGGHLRAWAGLLPDLGEALGVTPEVNVSGELARRQAFDAVVAAIAGLATRQPVLVTVDDLQYGADVTADVLAHLASQLGPAAVLLVGATRVEGLPALSALTARSTPVVLGPLPPSAVTALATAAGFAGRGDEVLARSQGHPLSVVASLHALAAGTGGVPHSVATAVAGQLDRLDPEAAGVATAASVLGTRVDPLLVAGLTAQPEVDVVLACERAVGIGLLARAGASYDFVNDLVRDAVLASVPRPLAVAYHRRAADLLAGRPEAMAGHAHEAGDLARAAQGYLVAGRTARRAAALDDALVLLDQAETDALATGDPSLTATVLLERARVHEAQADFDAADRDARAAGDHVAAARDARLDMRRLRLLGGDLSVGRRTPLDEVVEHNRTGLTRATELGDAVSAAMFRTRIAVLECTRLRLDRGLESAARGVDQSRAAGRPEALARSLDGLKAVHAYCGDAPRLAATLDELFPLLDELRLPWLRQWALLESSLVPAAADDWRSARRQVDEALAVNRETGYGAYTGYFLAHRGWLARLAGDLEGALDDGRRAMGETSPDAHPWWYATAVGALSTTLLELGRPDEVGALCTDGLRALGPEAGSAYRLRCLAPLVAATGERLEEADRLHASIEAPEGRAWVSGSDVYDALTTAWLDAGEPARAARVAQPLLDATRGSWRSVHERLAQRTSATSAAARSAPSEGTSS